MTLSVTTPDDGAGGSCVGHVVDNGDGSYTASYLPRVASARCKIAVMVNGTHVQGSPFAAIVAPGRTDPSQTECFGRGLYDGTSGAQCAFTIATKDAYGNACHQPGDAFTVRVTPVQSLVPELASYLRDYPVAVELTDNGDGSHNATFSADYAGFYQVDVTLDTAPVGQSPYTACVFNDSIAFPPTSSRRRRARSPPTRCRRAPPPTTASSSTTWWRCSVDAGGGGLPPALARGPSLLQAQPAAGGGAVARGDHRRHRAAAARTPRLRPVDQTLVAPAARPVV